MENLLKILELLNKPIHFFVIGLFVLIWGVWIQYSLDYIFLGILLVLLSICSFIDKQIKSNQLKKMKNCNKKKNKKGKKDYDLMLLKNMKTCLMMI